MQVSNFGTVHTQVFIGPAPDVENLSEPQDDDIILDSQA